MAFFQGTGWYSCIPADLFGDLGKSFENNYPFNYFRMSLENRSNIKE